jgi:hypothetical protein
VPAEDDRVVGHGSEVEIVRDEILHKWFATHEES